MQSLGQQLADSCGCFSQGTSALGHPKRALLKTASSGAKRQLTLLKGLGTSLVVVPFYELGADAGRDVQQLSQGTRSDVGAEGSSVALQYVRAVWQEHAGFQ